MREPPEVCERRPGDVVPFLEIRDRQNWDLVAVIELHRVYEPAFYKEYICAGAAVPPPGEADAAWACQVVAAVSC
jgi:hypothetical protein